MTEDFSYSAMSDYGAFGGSDEEYASVRKHNALVVSPFASLRQLGMES